MMNDRIAYLIKSGREKGETARRREGEKARRKKEERGKGGKKEVNNPSHILGIPAQPFLFPP